MVHIVGAVDVRARSGSSSSCPRFRRAGTRPGTAGRAGRSPSPGCWWRCSALWLTLFYEAQPGTGELLYVLRLIFGVALVVCLVLGFTAVAARDFAAHRAWMIRAYAIGLAAGTQVFTEGFGGAIFGTGVLAGDLAKGAGWVINLAVAEWAIRRPARRRRRTSARAHSQPERSHEHRRRRRTRSASTATSTTTGRPGSASST